MPTSPQFVNSVAALGVASPIRSIGVAVGSDAGQLGVVATLRLPHRAPSGSTVIPFGDFLGGVRVAAGDVTGDGIDDLVAVPGPGGLPIVVVYDGNTGALASGFFGLPPQFLTGLYVDHGRRQRRRPGGHRRRHRDRHLGRGRLRRR